MNKGTLENIKTNVDLLLSQLTEKDEEIATLKGLIDKFRLGEIKVVSCETVEERYVI